MVSNIGKRNWNEVGNPPAILLFLSHRDTRSRSNAMLVHVFLVVVCNCAWMCHLCAFTRRVRAHIENTTLYKADMWWNHLKLRDSPFGNVSKVWWTDVKRTKQWMDRTCISIRVVLLFLFKVLQVLRQMPKGGALHLHFASASSLEWVVNQGYLDSFSRSPSWDLEIGLYTYCI